MNHRAQMRKRTPQYLFFLSLLLLPVCCFADEGVSMFHFGSQAIFYFNLVVVITALICIKQFFWPRDNNVPFQIANLLLTIVYYIVSFSFLINNKQFYEVYENLNPLACIFKVFTSPDISSLLQWIILFGFVINILYLFRNRKGYYDRA